MNRLFFFSNRLFLDVPIFDPSTSVEFSFSSPFVRRVHMRDTKSVFVNLPKTRKHNIHLSTWFFSLLFSSHLTKFILFSSHFFTEILQSSIKYIEMSKNFLQCIDDETFQGLQLESLHLVDNNIQYFSEKCFK